MSDAAPTRRRRLGLSTKLYAAIAGAVALTLTASVVAWISFVELGQLQRRIARDHIPSITDSLRLAQQSALVAATASALLTATDESGRQQAMDALRGHQDQMAGLLARLDRQAAGATGVEAVRPLMATIAEESEELDRLLDELDRSVGRQLAIRAELADLTGRGVEYHRHLTDRLAPLPDDATMFLVTGYRSLDDDAPVPPDERYSEASLLDYAAVARLGGEANLIGGLLAEAANIPDPALLQPLAERIEAAADRFRNALDVADSDDEDPLGPALDDLVALGEGPGGILALRRDQLLDQRAAETLIHQSRIIAESLTSDVDRLVALVGARTEEAVAAANRAIDVGGTLLLVLNAVSIVGAVLIGWGYVARRITAPVVSITGAAAAFEAQRFDPESLARVRERRDELGDLARTFTRMAGEVQTRTDLLDLLVAERTSELNEKNAALEGAKERVEAELEIARSVQMAMLPQHLPDDTGYAGKAAMVPAREMGGDFYDFFPVGDHAVGLVIADVSGKGVPAAFFMAISRTILQGSARDLHAPGECLAAANDLLCRQNPLDLFVTVFYGVLDLRTGELRYANGGHNPPLLARAGGAIAALPGTSGVAMGVVPGLAYREAAVTLAPGDTLVLYTDGISEAMDREGRGFTEARLVGSLSGCSRRPVDTIVSDLVGAVKAFVGGAPQSDDITCLVVRYKGPRSGAPVRTAAG